MLDEIDWVLAGRGKANVSFLASFNSFVESFVLTDEIWISINDALHLNHAFAAWTPVRRPLVSLLTQEGNLRAFGWAQEFISKSEHPVGTVLYAFQASNDDFESGRWYPDYFAQAADRVRENLFRESPPADAPLTTPLLVAGGSGPESDARCVVVFERNTHEFLKYILSKASNSRLHPVLPGYATSLQSDAFPYQPAAINLYHKLASMHKVQIEELMRHFGYRVVSIPPLTSILLSRCRSREEIAPRLAELRSEFSELRSAGTRHERALASAETLQEQFEEIHRFNNYWSTFSGKIGSSKTRLAYRAWNVLKSASPAKWATSSIDEVAKEVQERFVLGQYKSLLDLWNLIQEGPALHNQQQHFERLFGGDLKVEDLRAYERLQNNVERKQFPHAETFEYAWDMNAKRYGS